jgi:ubiquinone/menaquinone biosynthesis C-methylase UbiE
MAADKGYRGIGMTGWAARSYARNADKGAREYEALARRLAAELPPGAAVLDVATGPGHLAVALAGLGLRATGLDVSRTCVEIAREKAAAAGVAAEFHEGNAAALPFPDASFDFAVCRASFKNFSDPAGALREMRRVLRPGGRALVADLRRDVTSAEIDECLRGAGLGPLGAWAARWAFRLILTRRAYTRERMSALADAAGFSGREIAASGLSFELSLRR